jgi:hypothetical protein
MIIGTSTLKGALAHSQNYFSYRASAMGGYTSFGGFGVLVPVTSQAECISKTTTTGACLQCCTQNFTSANRRHCRRDCDAHYNTVQPQCDPSNPCPAGQTCQNGACVNLDTGACNKVCTSPCSTGNTEDCCHYECPTGVTPPPPIQYTPYPVSGGVINTTDGSTFGSGSGSASPNWLLLGGIGLAAFFIGKSMFGAKP